MCQRRSGKPQSLGNTLWTLALAAGVQSLTRRYAVVPIPVAADLFALGSFQSAVAVSQTFAAALVALGEPDAVVLSAARHLIDNFLAMVALAPAEVVHAELELGIPGASTGGFLAICLGMEEVAVERPT